MTDPTHSAQRTRVEIVREAVERAEAYERSGVYLLPELRTTRIANAVLAALDANAPDAEGLERVYGCPCPHCAGESDQKQAESEG